MEITDIKIRTINDESKMKAIVSITFNNQFAIHDIKIINGINGKFIAMPSRKLISGEYKDIAHPINSETRKKIEEIVLKEYDKKLILEKQEVNH